MANSKNIEGDNVENVNGNGIGVMKGDIYYFSNPSIPIKLKEPKTIYTLPILSFKDTKFFFSAFFLVLLFFTTTTIKKVQFFLFLKVLIGYTLMFSFLFFTVLWILVFWQGIKITYFKNKFKAKNYIILDAEKIRIVSRRDDVTYKFNELRQIFVKKNIIGYTVYLYTTDLLYAKDFTVLDFDEAYAVLGLFKQQLNKINF